MNGLWPQLPRIVGDHTAIEAKATRKLAGRDLRGLQSIAEQSRFRRPLLVSGDGIEAVPTAPAGIPRAEVGMDGRGEGRAP